MASIFRPRKSRTVVLSLKVFQWFVLTAVLVMLTALITPVKALKTSTQSGEVCSYWKKCVDVVRSSGKSSLESTKVVGLPSSSETGDIRFRIETYYEDCTRNAYGGDSYWVRAEGLSVVHGTVTDHWNGTYSVFLPLYDIGTYTVHIRRDYSRCEGTAVCKPHILDLENSPLPGSPFHISVGKSALLSKVVSEVITTPNARWIVPGALLDASKRTDLNLPISHAEFEELYESEISFLKAVRSSAYYDERGVHIPYGGNTSKVLFDVDRFRGKWFHFIGDSVTSHVFRTIVNVLLSGYEVEVTCLEEHQTKLCVESYDPTHLLRSRFQYREYDGCDRKGMGSWCMRPIKVDDLYFPARICKDLRKTLSAYHRGRRCIAPGELALMYFPALNLTLSRRYTDIRHMPFAEHVASPQAEEYCGESRKAVDDELEFRRECRATEESYAHPYYSDARWCPMQKRPFSEVSEIIHLIAPWVLERTPGRITASPDGIYYSYGLHHAAYSCANVDAYEYAVRSVVDEIRETTQSSIVFATTTPAQFHMVRNVELTFEHKLNKLHRCITPYRVECLNDVLRAVAESEMERGLSSGRRHALLDMYEIADPRVDSPKGNIHYERGSVYSTMAVHALDALASLSQLNKAGNVV